MIDRDKAELMTNRIKNLPSGEVVSELLMGQCLKRQWKADISCSRLCPHRSMSEPLGGIHSQYRPFALAGFRDAQLCASGCIEAANMVLGEALYDVHVVTAQGGPLANSFGMTI